MNEEPRKQPGKRKKLVVWGAVNRRSGAPDRRGLPEEETRFGTEAFGDFSLKNFRIHQEALRQTDASTA